MHVLFATPTGGSAHASHYRAKSIVQATCLTHRFTYAEVDLLIVSKARNELVAAIPEDADVIWFVDSDILLPPNAGDLLSYIEDHPMVSGLYFARGAPHLPQVYNRATPGLTNFAFLPLINVPVKPFLADAVGAGCLLVQASVLRRLAEAHRAWQDRVKTWAEMAEPPEDVQRAVEFGASLCPYFEFLESCGEDFYFCMQMQYYLNIRPFVVPSVECVHEGVANIGRAHYEASLNRGLVHYSAEKAHKDRGVLAS